MVSPEYIRYPERIRGDGGVLNGFTLPPLEKLQELGERIIELRVARTVQAINRRTALPGEGSFLTPSSPTDQLTK